MGDYAVKIINRFSYKLFSEFFNLEQIKIKLEEIKNQNLDLYTENKKVIDLYLDNFDKKEHEFD